MPWFSEATDLSMVKDVDYTIEEKKKKKKSPN